MPDFVRTERGTVICACGATSQREVTRLPSGRILGTTFRCDACEARADALHREREREREAQQRATDVRRAIEQLAAPKLFADMRLTRFVSWGSVAQQSATGRMIQVARRFVGEISGGLTPPQFVAFMGAPGNGKSSAAYAIGNELAADYGLHVRVVSCADLVRDIRGAWRKNDTGPDEDTRLQAYIAPEFLAIDEVSTHAFYGQNIHQHLFDVINGRLNNERPTLLTTNESESDLAAILRPALYDRLQLGGIVDCGRESYRQWRAEQAA